MNFGFNQNVTYKGETYHIQTEDGGRDKPVVTTQVFKSGVIIATRRTDYSDIVKSDKCGEVVKDIMREQHSVMLRDLKAGALNLEKD